MLVCSITARAFGLCQGRQLAAARPGGGPRDLGISHLLHLCRRGGKSMGIPSWEREAAVSSQEPTTGESLWFTQSSRAWLPSLL